MPLWWSSADFKDKTKTKVSPQKYGEVVTADPDGTEAPLRGSHTAPRSTSRRPSGLDSSSQPVIVQKGDRPSASPRLAPSSRTMYLARKALSNQRRLPRFCSSTSKFLSTPTSLINHGRRAFATRDMRDPMTGETTTLPDIDASLLKVTQNPQPGTPPPSSKLVFGHTFTDHMLCVPWSSTHGWGVPEIRPYGPLQLEPSSVVLHYAQSLFEGLKAYRDETGKVTLFRPDMNMKRMNRTAARIALPTFDGDAVIALIKALVRLDSRWIPSEPGHSLYIRPTLIGTQHALGVGPSSEALLFVICSPVGPYYKGGFKPIALLGTTNYARACPGGIGGYKLAANYAPGIVPQLEAASRGYAQNLWLVGPDHHLTEVGTMNMFVVLKTDTGATELVTPPLGDIILPGVTRDSVLALARNHVSGKEPISSLPSDLIVSVRPITMKEVEEASKQGRLLELFGSGTAAIISPVNRIGYMGRDIDVPVGEKGMGPVAASMHAEIVGRQLGKIPSEWAVVVD